MILKELIAAIIEKYHDRVELDAFYAWTMRHQGDHKKNPQVFDEGMESLLMLSMISEEDIENAMIDQLLGE